ncbi:unnamed protein product [Ectocarpus sp. 13 AM-2016]
MKPRWELGVLLTLPCFSSAQSAVSSDCSTSFISDGWCDSSNNNSNCDYDGGDCCSCDCFDDTYECGVVGFTCIDPTSSCYYHHYYDDDGEQQATYSPSPVNTVTYSPTAYPVYDYDHDDDHDDHDHDDSPTYYNGFLDDDHDDGFFDSPDASDDDNDRATSDDAPVGAIVGGAVGGTAFLAAAAVLACMFVTGRLKCSKCSNSSDPPGAPTPAGDGTTTVATKAYPAPVAAGGGALTGPRSDLPPSPSVAGDGSAGTATKTYPAPVASAAGASDGPRADLPPPPAFSTPAGDRSAQSATETFPDPTASAAAPAAPARDLPPPPAYGSYDHDVTTTEALPPPYGHPVNQYPQPK